MKNWLSVVVLSSAAVFAESQGRVRQTILPVDGAVNVPLNAVPRSIFLQQNLAGIEHIFKRVGDAEIELPFERRIDADGWVASAVLSERLEPETEYVLELRDATRQRFNTGTREDFEAPSKPDVSVEARGFSWDLNFASEPESSTLALIHHDGRIIGVASTDARVLGTGNFSAPAGAKFDLDVQLMDVAGNVSETRLVRDVTNVRGCSAAPGGAVLMLALTFLRRRRAK